MERGRYTEYKYTFSVVKIYNIKVDTFLHQVRLKGGGGVHECGLLPSDSLLVLLSFGKSVQLPQIAQELCQEKMQSSLCLKIFTRLHKGNSEIDK